MELSQYIILEKEKDPTFTQTKFAKLLDVTPFTLVRLIRGRQIPSGELALKVEKLTKGKVKVWDLILKGIECKKLAKKADKQKKPKEKDLEKSLLELGII